MGQSSGTVSLAQYRFRFEAEHVLGFLEQNGVDAVLWGDDVGGLNPAIGFVEAFEIRVRHDQEASARELLEDFGMSRRIDDDHPELEPPDGFDDEPEE
jgi:hypothetical protein